MNKLVNKQTNKPPIYFQDRKPVSGPMLRGAGTARVTGTQVTSHRGQHGASGEGGRSLRSQAVALETIFLIGIQGVIWGRRPEGGIYMRAA